MIIRSGDLSSFVAETDRLGGPGTKAAIDYWRNFEYLPQTQVDTGLDPDGVQYFGQMMQLYEEISGRKLDPGVTELTPLDVDSLSQLESPYSFATPSERIVHYLRLGKALHAANLSSSAEVLDMGCGWGLSSEFMAQLGFHVTAVDINPLFVDLVTRRARRLDLKICTVCASFNDFKDDPAKFDAALFYECFHHAATPRLVLRNVSRMLKDRGILILAGEPIQDSYWPHWGLRLDALSVYCIRKFGWFESGWSLHYLKKILREAGFIPNAITDPDPSVGVYVISVRKDFLHGSELIEAEDALDWWIEGRYLISNRAGRVSHVSLYPPSYASIIEIVIDNFSPWKMNVEISLNGEDREFVLETGENLLSFSSRPVEGVVNFEFSTISWSPSVSLGNGDVRLLGFHLRSVNFKH